MPASLFACLSDDTPVCLSQEKGEYVIVTNNALPDERLSCKYLPFLPAARGADQIGRHDRNGGSIIKYASC